MRNVSAIIKTQKGAMSLNKYSGKWIAFLGNKIVGNKKTLKDLMREMEKKGIDEKITVFLVPKKKEKYLVV